MAISSEVPGYRNSSIPLASTPGSNNRTSNWCRGITELGTGNDIYFYKMTHDTGAAPCVDQGCLSLAICKPRIRASVVPGDIVIGFGGKRYGEKLIYIACITEKLTKAKYYVRPEFDKRSDCIYTIADGKAKVKKGARFHEDGSEIPKDIGDGLKKANVLLSNDFRYFGKSGTDEYKTIFPVIGKAVSNLARGHRINHFPELRADLLRMKEWVWSNYPHKVLDRPTNSKSSCRH